MNESVAQSTLAESFQRHRMIGARFERLQCARELRQMARQRYRDALDFASRPYDADVLAYIARKEASAYVKAAALIRFRLFEPA